VRIDLNSNFSSIDASALRLAADRLMNTRDRSSSLAPVSSLRRPYKDAQNRGAAGPLE
jgi:hypothetical protein